VPKLSPISWRALIRRLKALGYDGPYRGGRHPYMVRGNLVITVPNPHDGDISTDLLSRLLRQAEISRAEWLES
jgi:predicted RNA binding protein YcfA (HicA-like mRNA interferase family)